MMPILFRVEGISLGDLQLRAERAVLGTQQELGFV